MGKHRCVVGVCNNDKRYPLRYEIHSNVTDGNLKFHKIPVDPVKRAAWIHFVSKGRKDFVPPNNFYVCSNHFIDGKPTKENHNPILFLTPSMNVQGTPRKKNRPPPKKRIMFEKYVSLSSPSTVSDLPSIVSNAPPSAVLDPESEDMEVDQNSVPEILEEFVMPPLNMIDACHDFHIPMQFSQITRESDVRTFTGFNGTEIFKTIFDAVKRKGMVMTYWDGSKRTLRLRKRPSSIESTE